MRPSPRLRTAPLLVSLLCAALSVSNLILGTIWLREGRRERAGAAETLRRHTAQAPPQKGGCADEHGIVGLMLAAAAIGPGVRCAEGQTAFIAGLAGLGVALTLWAGATLGQGWTVRLGMAHASLAGLLALPSFIFSWHGDAQFNAVLWFVYASVALLILLRTLRRGE